jgi:hypothetical protein
VVSRAELGRALNIILLCFLYPLLPAFLVLGLWGNSRHHAGRPFALRSEERGHSDLSSEKPSEEPHDRASVSIECSTELGRRASQHVVPDEHLSLLHREARQRVGQQDGPLV